MLIGIACSPQAHLQVFKGLIICFSSSIVVALAFHHMKRKTIFSFFFQSLITNSINIDVADVLHVNSKQRGRHYRKFSIKKVYGMCLVLAKYFPEGFLELGTIYSLSTVAQNDIFRNQVIFQQTKAA